MRRHSAIGRILLVLNILPMHVKGYDCNLGNPQGCDQGEGGESGITAYSNCMVQQFGVSAFIQCASQERAPDLTAEDNDGGATDLSPTEILTNAMMPMGLPIPGCECPLANKIVNAASSDNFATSLCNKDPKNAGLCCLKECIMGLAPEHDIEAFCSGKFQDLMNAPELPDSCGTNSNENSSEGPSEDSSSAAAASSTDGPYATEAIRPSSGLTLSSSTSIIPTTSPAASSIASTGGTSSSPTAQATPSTGAATNPRITLSDRLKKSILVVLPILAVF